MSPNLPQEIVEMIVDSAAKNGGYYNMLTVSRSFQAAAERWYWRKMKIRSEDVELFASYCRGMRVSFVRNIKFTITFPMLYYDDDEPLKCRETSEDLQAMDELFTRQVSDLFVALNTIQEGGARNELRGIDLTIVTDPQEDDGEMPCHHRRVHNWRLHLLNPETLPELQSIRSLTLKSKPPCTYDLYDNGVRPIDLRVIIDLISKLPNLESLYCPYLFERFPHPYKDEFISHFGRPWEGPWRDTRHDFAKAVEDARLAEAGKNLPWATLKKADLSFWGRGEWDDMDQKLSLPDLVKPRTHDPLSSALRVLSQNLAELNLRVISDSTLFWPSCSTAETDFETPSWPHLRRLRVEVHPATPNGQWYFAGPRNEGIDAVGYTITEDHYPPLIENKKDKDWDELDSYPLYMMDTSCPDNFRTEPADQTVEPLFEAFTRALKSMPAIEEAELFSWPRWDPSSEREDEYEEKGLFVPQRSTMFQWGVKYVVDDEKRRLEWRVGSWRPSDALLALFHDIGDGQQGKELEEEWMELERKWTF